jgi:hypothetical protein
VSSSSEKSGDSSVGQIGVTRLGEISIILIQKYNKMVWWSNVERPNVKRPNVERLNVKKPNVEQPKVACPNVDYSGMSNVFYNTGPNSPLLGPWFRPVGPKSGFHLYNTGPNSRWWENGVNPWLG